MRGNTFIDQKDMEQMFKFRKEGWIYSSIGIFFDCDFSTVYHHCVKANIKPQSSSLSFSLTQVIKTLGIEVKGPKSYADYLREYQERHSLGPSHSLR